MDAIKESVQRRRGGVMWAQIGLWVGTLVLSYLLAPEPEKPQDAVPHSRSDFNVPTITRGEPKGILFGSRWMESVVGWWGDFTVEPIYREVDSGSKK
jgi:hypothetical protein